jgi:hypothetical protein
VVSRWATCRTDGRGERFCGKGGGKRKHGRELPGEKPGGLKKSQRDHDERGKTDVKNERLKANISIEELSHRRREKRFGIVNKELLP